MSTGPGHRNTHQRQVIFEELCQLTSHPTADELYQLVRKRLPRVSLGTVYRNLEAMTGQGLVQRIEAGGPPMRYDANMQRHYHLRCLGCGAMRDVPLERLRLFERELEELDGFEIVGHRLELIGICPRCKASTTHTTSGRLAS